MVKGIRSKYLLFTDWLLMLILLVVLLSLEGRSFSLSAKDKAKDKDVYDLKIEKNDGFFMSSAVGGGLNWMLKKEYGQEKQKKIVPEGSFYTYFRIVEPFYIRHAMHIGYSGMNPQMPYSLQIEEKEVFFLSDLAFLYNWYVVPALSAGVGSVYRKIDLKVEDPIYIENDEISDSEWIFTWYIQLGVTFPVFKNIFVLEPFIRFLNVHEDERISTAFGFDVSYYLVKRWW